MTEESRLSERVVQPQRGTSSTTPAPTANSITTGPGQSTPIQSWTPKTVLGSLHKRQVMQKIAAAQLKMDEGKMAHPSMTMKKTTRPTFCRHCSLEIHWNPRMEGSGFTYHWVSVTSWVNGNIAMADCLYNGLKSHEPDLSFIRQELDELLTGI